MAMSATIALSSATAKINQVITATLTISNSGGSPVNVTSIQPVLKLTGAPSNDFPAANAGVASLGPGENVTVPAGGTLVMPFGAVFFASSGSTTYDVGAVCQSNDGSIFSPTAATVTIS